LAKKGPSEFRLTGENGIGQARQFDQEGLARANLETPLQRSSRLKPSEQILYIHVNSEHSPVDPATAGDYRLASTLQFVDGPQAAEKLILDLHLEFHGRPLPNWPLKALESRTVR